MFYNLSYFLLSVRPGIINIRENFITVPENIGKVLVPLIRTGGTDGLIQIQYSSVDGTARGMLDYVPVSGVVAFNEGEMQKTVEIVIINDDIREPAETFQLQLFNSSAAPDVINFRRQIRTIATIITITDDDSKLINLPCLHFIERKRSGLPYYCNLIIKKQ